MCPIHEFDGSQAVRDGRTRCRIDCYRDSSVMQHIGVSAHEAYKAVRRGDLAGGARALTRRGDLCSIRAVMEELLWLLRF